MSFERIPHAARLAVCAGLAGVALMLALRGTASAATNVGCAQVESYLSFCISVPTAVRRETTVPMVALPAMRADVLVETAVPGAEALAVASGVDRSVTRIETLFGRPFTGRPRVLLFGTTASFATGMHELFDYSPDMARSVASTYGGVFDRSTATIAVNWSTAGGYRIDAAIAHELTHLMIYDVARGRDVPTWLDEGLATVVEQSLLVAQSSDASDLVGRAVAATGAISLAQLTTVANFHAAYARIGRPLYDFAAYTVRTLEARASFADIVAVIDHVGGEVDVQAWSFGLDSSLARQPTIAVSASDNAGNVAWTLVSGRPNTPLTVTIAGPRGYWLTYTIVTDELGMYRGTFGATAPHGVYTLDAGAAVATFVSGR